MNIHIFHDDKFTNGAIEQFEQHYPNQNIYIVLLYDTNALVYTSTAHKVTVFHIRDKSIVKNIGEIIEEQQVKNLFIHYLDTYKASIALKILSNFPILKFYWIFFGGDLYDYLSRYHQYDVIDSNKFKEKQPLEDFKKTVKYLLWFGWSPKNAMKKAFERLDYFCFWNEYDYDLFTSKINTKAKHKNFIYLNALGNPNFPMVEKKNVLLINHSASVSGNHLFVFDYIKDLPLKNRDFTVLLPLSYGNMTYGDEVEKNVHKVLSTQIKALRAFMPMHDYQTMLSEVKIAIFGMRRQEAAGNVFQLINMGAKVFFREENTLLHWLRKRNFIVFSLENDYTELAQLDGLSEVQINHNRLCYTEAFNDIIQAEWMQELIATNSSDTLIA